jgi:hypothetical protein
MQINAQQNLNSIFGTTFGSKFCIERQRSKCSQEKFIIPIKPELACQITWTFIKP